MILSCQIWTTFLSFLQSAGPVTPVKGGMAARQLVAHYSLRDLNPLSPAGRQAMFRLNEVTKSPTTTSPTVISKGRPAV